jgi:DNA-binding NarL/FixJ family response regulator
MKHGSASPTIFLAEDSAAIRERLALLLGPEHIVGEAATPASCIDGILAANPDVVVLDVQLEGGTGLQVLEVVREASPRIAFVVFTNSSGAAYRRCYLAAGADCFLDKNSEFDLLPDAVRGAVASH